MQLVGPKHLGLYEACGKEEALLEYYQNPDTEIAHRGIAEILSNGEPDKRAALLHQFEKGGAKSVQAAVLSILSDRNAKSHRATWRPLVFGDDGIRDARYLDQCKASAQGGPKVTAREAIPPMSDYGSREPSENSRLRWSGPLFRQMHQELAESGIQNPILVDMCGSFGPDVEAAIRAGFQRIILNEVDPLLLKEAKYTGHMADWEGRGAQVEFMKEDWGDLFNKIKPAQLLQKFPDADGLVIINMGNSWGFISDALRLFVIEQVQQTLEQFAITRYGSVRDGRRSVKAGFDVRIYNSAVLHSLATAEDLARIESLTGLAIPKSKGNNRAYPGPVDCRPIHVIDKEGGKTVSTLLNQEGGVQRLGQLVRDDTSELKMAVTAASITLLKDEFPNLFDSIGYTYEYGKHFATLIMRLIGVTEFSNEVRKQFRNVQTHSDYDLNPGRIHDPKGNIAQIICSL